MRLPCATLLGLGLGLGLAVALARAELGSSREQRALRAGDLTPYSNCGFTGALVGLQLGDCHEWPCVFQRGEPIEAEVLFTAVWEYHSLKTTINALFGGIAIPLYVDEQMCKGLLFGTCPATVGDALSYLANLTVGQDLPTISVTLEWSITNGSGDTIVCAQVPAEFH